MTALGWCTSAMAAQPAVAPGPAAACDRECLRGAITTYLDALVRHDVSQLPWGARQRILNGPPSVYVERSTLKTQDCLQARRWILSNSMWWERLGFLDVGKLPGTGKPDINSIQLPEP
jgi:hypothetical protein